ncbi:hypothetical protein MY11210_007836 [Beauveria gryllotalpidicola]
MKANVIVLALLSCLSSKTLADLEGGFDCRNDVCR